jgi:hypothetical protein
MSDRPDPPKSPLDDSPLPSSNGGTSVDPNQLVPHEPAAPLQRITLTLPPKLADEVKHLARERGLTANTLLQLLIRAGMLGLKAEEVGKPGSGLILRIDGEDHHILFP